MWIYRRRKDSPSWRKEKVGGWHRVPTPRQQVDKDQILSVWALIMLIVRQRAKWGRKDFFLVFENQEVEDLRQMLFPLVGEVSEERLLSALNELLIKPNYAFMLTVFFFTLVGNNSLLTDKEPYRLALKVNLENFRTVHSS